MGERENQASTAPKKVVYLFGAGATCAELRNSEVNYDTDRIGLSIGDVTRRVILLAQRSVKLSKGKRMIFQRANDSSDIELFISLIESNYHSLPEASKTVDELKRLVKKDILRVLATKRTKKFFLHKALFELHKYNNNEKVLGFITLNYDTILDAAYKRFHGIPDYSFSFPKRRFKRRRPPLLKLHGSFDWNGIPIIPLGLNKNYLRLPYNYIWGRALETLVNCDQLRVIGCSMSQNDINLIDLLFKAHLERTEPFEIVIINSDRVCTEIKKKYSFFPKISSMNETARGMISHVKDNDNHFLEWLKVTGRQELSYRQINSTKYLKRILT